MVANLRPSLEWRIFREKIEYSTILRASPIVPKNHLINKLISFSSG
jgi:hypothetical protein